MQDENIKFYNAQSDNSKRDPSHIVLVVTEGSSMNVELFPKSLEDRAKTYVFTHIQEKLEYYEEYYNLAFYKNRINNFMKVNNAFGAIEDFNEMCRINCFEQSIKWREIQSR